MRFSDSDSSDETSTSTSDATESSTSGQTDKESCNDSSFKEDRFRVDRRKLEQMLQGETKVSNGRTAEDFFYKVMEDTKTKISWPSKLKVGAKSKKDPHIKIVGDPENVHMAKEKILEILDTKKNKVTLKMDVSFTDHSHIIGKGGRSIQQVMEDTGCHIHFPDSNRNSAGEKSNQVSIAGLPAGVEKARCQIRELLPMVLTFDIPHSNGFLQPVPDASSAIQLIQQKHGFTVSFRPKLRAITVVVRGSRKQFLQQKQGVQLLMNYLTGGSGAVLPVSLSMEVMPQHHAFVMGKGNCNITNITRETGATVTFPEPSHSTNYISTNAFHATPVRQAGTVSNRSTVVISGHIDSVCAAWQQLMGCLPLVLMFDLKEGQDLDSTQVARLMNQSEVNIVIRPKPKQHTKCLLVRGAEKDSRLLFEIRRQLLRADPSGETLPICCEKHAKNSSSEISIPELISSTPNTNGMHCNNQVNTSFTNGLHTYQQLNSHILQAPLLPLQLNGTNDLSSLCGGQGNYPLLPWLLHQLSGGQESPLYNALAQALLTDLAVASLLNSSHKDFSTGPPFSDQASSSSQPSSLSSPNDSPCVSPVFMTKMQGITGKTSSESMDNLHGERDGFPSPKSWNNPLGFGGDGNTKIISESYSDFPECPMMSNSSSEQLQAHPEPLPTQSVQAHPRVLKPMQQNTLFPARKVHSQGRPLVAPSVSCITKEEASVGAANHSAVTGSIGCERRSRDISAALADYNAKKLQAVQAVQQKEFSEARIPTDVWRGYGFSKTLPEDLLRNKLQESRVLSPRRVDPIPESPVGAWRDDWYSQASSIQNPFTEKKNGFVTSIDSAIPSFSSSNYFDSNLLPKDLTKDIKDLTHLLSLLGLERYMEVFQQQQVDLSTFLTLTDRDLQELSISSFGRRKMLKAISELKQPGFQPAPGAERRALFSRQQTCCASGLGPDWDW